MIVDYFNMDGMSLTPLEAHTPLIIDSDTHKSDTLLKTWVADNGQRV